MVVSGGGEFLDDLTAETAGTGGFVRFGGHHHPSQSPGSQGPLADCLDDGRAFRANGSAVTGIFHVTTGKYLAVAGLNRGTDLEVGIGCMGLFPYGPGRCQQLIPAHITDSR